MMLHMEGDYAHGLRILPVEFEGPDYARGLRTLRGLLMAQQWLGHERCRTRISGIQSPSTHLKWLTDYH